MSKFLEAIALSLLAGCVAPAPPPVTPPAPAAEMPPERGTPVTIAQKTYGGYADNALEDALSYAAQGDTAALEKLLSGDVKPEAIAAAEGEAFVFEGCYYGPENCELMWLRQPGETDKWVFRAEDLAVDR